ncbi:MAG: FtsQ-type POTRA domain-containing protein [Ignavibacteriae bacterium]|nr:FtsQ-type POTRA domain-containing protein [Ignavibacteriota bacterium]
MDEWRQPDTPKRPSAKKSFLLMALLLLTLLALAVYVNAWKEECRAIEVLVEGNRISSSKEILALAKVSPNARLFELDLYAIEQRVLNMEYVKSAAVHRDIPNRVRISIDERVPVAAIVLDKLYYLDAEGVVLPPARSQYIFDLPVLNGSMATATLIAGKQTTDATVREALRILSVAREVGDDVYKNISELRLDANREFMFYTSEFGIPVVLGREHIGAKLVKFEGFWNSAVVREGVDMLQYIDLRFEDQVVVRWSHKDAHS